MDPLWGLMERYVLCNTWGLMEPYGALCALWGLVEPYGALWSLMSSALLQDRQQRDSRVRSLLNENTKLQELYLRIAALLASAAPWPLLKRRLQVAPWINTPLTADLKTN